MPISPRRPKGPFPDPAFPQQVAEAVMPPFQDCLSGEITADAYGRPLGVARFAGRVADVVLSLGQCGRQDDASNLYAEADVFINGVTCISTKPKVEAYSGEASTSKSSIDGADSGTTEAVLATADSFSPGDHISWSLEITRDGSPTTEISNPCVMVELMPD